VSLVFDAAFALLRAQKISLTSIGRAIAERTSQKHGIKRMDRLLGNRRLWEERFVFYRAIAARLLSPSSRPIIIVDWTSLTTTMWTLNAAVPVEGRAVVLYSESYPISRYLKPAVNRRFLRNLREVLPAGCRPIIVTDAGFRSPWMREVVAIGWDYVCRLRGLNRLRQTGTDDWLPLEKLFSIVGRRERDLGIHAIGLRTRHVARIIGVRKRGTWKRSAAEWRELWGPLAKSRRTKHLRAAREPWILATSLQSSAPRKIVNHYKRRMQIEETFRDTKNPRFGLSMAEARTKISRRADLLTLLANLAHLLSVLAGLIAEKSGLTPRFQANTVRTSRVFSLSRLGRLALASADLPRITAVAANAAWVALKHRIALDPF
jgi:hypothetical protein